MLYLILSIICSVSVGVIFKSAKRYDTCITQIVAWNYIIAILCCLVMFNPEIEKIDSSSPWALYLPLSLLLPSIFLFLAMSINHMGIVKTDVAQRLSLFIPILAAWFIFKEEFNGWKIIGLAFGFPAILLILNRKNEDRNNSKNWIYPAIVLLGFGIIDILFKQLVLHTTLSYTTSLFIVFCGALLVAWMYVLYEILVKKISLKVINFGFGSIVGIFNFCNILFYLLAHREFAKNPSTVFAAMNMGVIFLGSLTGIFVFKEKVTKLNYFGLFLALLSIVFITISQIYK